jgi:Domain of unknown function (DUF4145)
VELQYGEVENTQDVPTLVSLLQETALFLWKNWPKDMQVVLWNPQTRTFTMRGRCPHGPHDSAFVSSTVHVDQSQRWIAVMQCQGCAKYILAIAQHAPNQGTLQYQEHYPLGKPDDTVAPEIPTHIQPDFQEALRCRFVDAYNATAEMCRRAIEASCIDLKAPRNLKVLEDKIDWLEQHRIITPFLRDVAHKIRLGGNRAAHPPEDGPVNLAAVAENEAEDGPIQIITKEHADAIIQFTREFFHHVYVVPKQLDKYDFSKPKAVKP